MRRTPKTKLSMLLIGLLCCLSAKSALADSGLNLFLGSYFVRSFDEAKTQGFFLTFLEEKDAARQLFDSFIETTPTSVAYQTQIPINALVQFATKTARVSELSDVAISALYLEAPEEHVRFAILDLLLKLESPHAMKILRLEFSKIKDSYLAHLIAEKAQQMSSKRERDGEKPDPEAELFFRENMTASHYPVVKECLLGMRNPEYRDLLALIKSRAAPLESDLSSAQFLFSFIPHYVKNQISAGAFQASDLVKELKPILENPENEWQERLASQVMAGIPTGQQCNGTFETE